MADDDIESLQQVIMHGGTQAFSLIPAGLKKVILEKQWRNRVDKDGKPFATFEAFATHRLWQGLETTIEDLTLFCRKQPEVQRLILDAMEPGREQGGDHGNQHTGGKRQGDNVTLPQRGNSSTYTAKRLKRDRPDLFAQVLDGKLSVNAAAIEAGFRKQRAPLEQIQKLWAKLDDAGRKAHLEWTLKHCATCGRAGTWEGGIPEGMWCDACCEEGARQAAE